MKLFVNILSEFEDKNIRYGVHYIKKFEDRIKNLPTIIIGLSNAQKYISNFNILKKEYVEQNLYWTFTKRERGADYYFDIEKFYNQLSYDLTSIVEYEYLNIITNDIYKKIISSNENKIVYVDRNKFLFLFFYEKNKIYGISLSTYSFINRKDSNLIIDYLKKFDYNKFINNFLYIPKTIKRNLGNEIHRYIALAKYFKI